GALLARDLLPRIVGDVAEMAVPPHPGAGQTATDRAPGAARAAGTEPPGASGPARVAGTYDRLHQRVEVTGGDGGVRLTTEPSGVLARLGAVPVTIELAPVDARGGLWTGRNPVTGVGELVVFTGPPGEPARSVHLDGRMHRRVG
ncbi:MAG: hypothetical protein ACLFXM_02415, partial [Acidimicrobiia bacterium]